MGRNKGAIMKNLTRPVRWIISYITILIFALVAMTLYFYEPPTPEQEEPYKPPVFAYPLTDPEFLQYGNIIVSYKMGVLPLNE